MVVLRDCTCFLFDSGSAKSPRGSLAVRLQPAVVSGMMVRPALQSAGRPVASLEVAAKAVQKRRDCAEASTGALDDMSGCPEEQQDRQRDETELTDKVDQLIDFGSGIEHPCVSDPGDQVQTLEQCLEQLMKLHRSIPSMSLAVSGRQSCAR